MSDINSVVASIANISTAELEKARVISAKVKRLQIRWGKELVEHYQWGNPKLHIAKHLVTAANANEDWRLVCTKLNRLILRREERALRRRGKAVQVNDSTNPIEVVDLINLNAWKGKEGQRPKNEPRGPILPCEPIPRSELPDYFDFDLYGLVVRRRHGVEVSIATQLIRLQSASSDSPSNTNIDPAIVRIDNLRRAVTYAGQNHDRSAVDGDGIVFDGSENQNQSAVRANEAADETSINNAASKVPNNENSKVVRPLPVRERNSQMALLPAEEQLELFPTSETSATQSLVADSPSAQFTNEQIQTQQSQLSLSQTSRSQNPQLQSPNYDIPQHNVTESDRSSPSTKSSPGRLKRPCSPQPCEDNGYGLRSRKRINSAGIGGDSAIGDINNEKADVKDELALLKDELEHQLDSGNLVEGTYGKLNLKDVLRVVRVCNEPARGKDADSADALYLTGEEAKAALERKTPTVPIITTGQQYFEWATEQPLREFLSHQVLLDRDLSVQDPSLPVPGPSARLMKLRELAQRMSSDIHQDLAYNALEFPCSLLNVFPQFLAAPNANLLNHVRDFLCSPDRLQRQATTSGRVAAWWAQKEQWALISEGGTCTAPHTDATGYWTWITVQQGKFVFAWLSKPTVEEVEYWIQAGSKGSSLEPDENSVGRWCYQILEAGTTVFFPSRTVHAVFRPRDSPTFALGGHVLLWSGVVQWMKTLLWQFQTQDCTNEDDQTELTLDLVNAVRNLVADVTKESGIYRDLIGGEEPAAEFEKAYQEWYERFGQFLEQSGRATSLWSASPLLGRLPPSRPKPTKVNSRRKPRRKRP